MTRRRLGFRLQTLLGVAAIFCFVGPPPAAAAAPDGLPTEVARAKPGKRSWSIREFTTIRLVQREPGSTPNQHPSAVSPAALARQLSSIQYVDGSAAARLFHPDEVAELAEPLAQALATAGPDEDLTLVSTSRRGEGFLSLPTAVTARLFVQDGALQMLVNDTRLDFVGRYRGTHREPEFEFGSRAKPGSAVLQGGGRSVRPDWLALSLSATDAPTAAAVPAPAPAPARVAPAAAAPAAAPSDDIERRLTVLKRLRERNLISEEEYQTKRREILQQL